MTRSSAKKLNGYFASEEIRKCLQAIEPNWIRYCLSCELTFVNILDMSSIFMGHEEVFGEFFKCGFTNKLVLEIANVFFTFLLLTLILH